MQKPERQVLRFAILSRLILISLMVVWRILFPPYDSSAQLNPSCLSSSPTTGSISHLAPSDRILYPRIGAAIESSVVWDGVYFARIAECGYEYEQTFAFLPLLPLSIALFSRSVFSPLIPAIGYKAVIALSGYVLNNIAFVFAAFYFYKLSYIVLKDSKVSLQASALFCFNPASIFYSSLYSESFYALFSFCGLFYLFSGSNAMAMLLLGLSGAARSNGAINAGYFCFKALFQAYDAITNKKNIRLALQATTGGAACSVFLFIPFATFQAYGYYSLCLNGASDGLRPWCNSRVPNLYGYLQSHYWGVGFLKYFEVKQLPNFLLASPILAMAIASIVYYTNLLPQTRKLFGTHDSKRRHEKGHSGESISSNIDSTSKNFKGSLILTRRKRMNEAKSSEKPHYLKLFETNPFISFKQGYYSPLVFPFILHLGFMTFMALFVMNVQVSTRFLSASPPIYWFASYVMLSPSSTSRRVSFAIWFYFISYILLGSLLFSNFYPFT